jgi:hypothetical protein
MTGMFQVEIRVPEDSALSDRMEEMRMWLDERHFEPANFRYSFGLPGIVCRVDFPVEQEATAFAGAFEGKLVGGSPIAI